MWEDSTLTELEVVLKDTCKGMSADTEYILHEFLIYFEEKAKKLI